MGDFRAWDEDEHLEVCKAAQLFARAGHPVFSLWRAHGLCPRWVVAWVEFGFRRAVGDSGKNVVYRNEVWGIKFEGD
jgi:hypothetical protein